MGLSRNKVAVSEGAAGSPPFYGDTDMFSRTYRIENRHERVGHMAECGIYCCSILSDCSLKEEKTLKWGCSSAGRAPALQAGGHGFDSHHLHQLRKQQGEG